MEDQTSILITADPDIMGGQPCFHNTRVPVYVVVGLMAQGEKYSDLKNDFPNVTEQMFKFAATIYFVVLQEHGKRITKTDFEE